MLRTAVVLVLAFLLVGPEVERDRSQETDVQFWKTEWDTVYVARLPPLIVVADSLPATSSDGQSAASAASASQSDRVAARQTSTREQGAPRRTDPASGGVLGGPESRSAASNASNSISERGVGTGGLLVNETFTVVGAQFYRAFYEAWSVPEEAARYNFTITVTEQPAPRLGTQLTVRLEGTTLFQSRLRPNTEGITQRARRATQRAALYLRRYYEPRTVY